MKVARRWVVHTFALAWAACAHLGCPPGSVDPCLSQVSTDGFGNADNRYAWSMTPFGSALFVGTLETLTSGGGDAELDRGSAARAAMGEGAEIFRYDGSSWARVVAGGFGDVANEGVRNLVVSGGAIHAGTLNATTGGEVWRSADGVEWTQINADGFGDPANSSVRGMTEWRGQLWVGTVNSLGAQLWRHDGATWTQIARDGLTGPDNDAFADLLVWRDHLYVGTWNDEHGAEIHRFDGTTWEALVGGTASVPAGFGDPNDTGIFSLVEFEGAIYASTRNFITGFSVWRSFDDGASWQRVVDDGFSDPRQRYGWRLHVHQGQLFLGTWVMTTGDDAFRVGGRLYRSRDGATWVEEVGPFGSLAPPGFADDLNYGLRSLATYQDALFVGTAQCFFCDFPVTGAEVWRRDASCPE
jgi:hypothetical protein